MHAYLTRFWTLFKQDLLAFRSIIIKFTDNCLFELLLFNLLSSQFSGYNQPLLSSELCTFILKINILKKYFVKFVANIFTVE